MHWGEPAEIMRYLEIIPGKQTSAETIRITRRRGEARGKELSTLNAGICGFVSNRMMYAMMRKAFHLVESGVADLETVDRSFRNDHLLVGHDCRAVRLDGSHRHPRLFDCRGRALP